MPSLEREASRDSDISLRHQLSSSSDGGRAIVPMWDSSDPERAPPPLPMNPSSPAASRPNTSSAIQSAHAALTEKARESGYITNATPKRIEISPELSLIKGAAHKRIKSLQPGNVRDMSSFLEGSTPTNGSRSPERSIGRSGTSHTSRDFLESRSPEKDSRFLLEGKSPEKDTRFLLEGKLLERSPEKDTRVMPEGGSPEKDPKITLEKKSPEKDKEDDSSRCTTPTPTPREIHARDISKLRPSLRKPPQSILGENIPPQSATMLALQSMAGKDTDTALSNITNGSTALVRTPQTFDAISNQILSLTSIATSLQREMAQLSRRSKDNATDLVSLKEATNARDEDIRKSLRDLVSNLNEAGSRSSSNIYGSGGLYLDSKAHNSPGSRGSKNFILPRMPSPNSFGASLDRDSISTPASFSPDTVTTIALLEKIIREMGTREGHDKLISSLEEVSERLNRDGSSTAKKLDELLGLLKLKVPHSLVTTDGSIVGSSKARYFSFSETPRLELDFDSQGASPVSQRVGTLLASGGNKESRLGRGSEIISDEFLKIIRNIKDSVAQGGGLTAEVKALVRELRGEVLGMGREIGRKLDQVSSDSAKEIASEKEHVARVVQNALEELKVHMDQLIREHRRQSASKVPKPIDYQEIYSLVQSAISEHDQSKTPGPEKEDIIKAVKDAWETYKPEIEVQQFGLERDELLTCLKEGIEEFVPKSETSAERGATREEVFAAVVEGLRQFAPPQVVAEPSLSREEILDAVRECLEEFEFPSAPPPEPFETGITRDDMLDAVKEGLHKFDFAASTAAVSRDVDGGLTRNDMLEAVRECLNNFDFAANTTALIREGAGDSSTRDDILEAVKEGLNNFDFAANMTALIREGAGDSLTRDHILEAVKEGLTNFDFAANTIALIREEAGDSLTRDDLYEAVKACFGDSAVLDAFPDQILDRLQEITETARVEFQAISDEARQNIASSGRITEQALDATKDGFEKLRLDMEIYVDKACGLDLKDAVLHAIRENFDSLRLEIDALSSKSSATSLEAVCAEMENFRESISNSLVPGSIGVDKDGIIEVLREGFDSLRRDINRSRDSHNSVVSGTGETMDALHDGLASLRTEVDKIANKPAQPLDMTLNYEILDTLKSGLESLRADIDRLRNNELEEKEIIEINESAIVPIDSLRRNDIENLEFLITQVRSKVEAIDNMPPPTLQPAPGTLSRTDLANVEKMIKVVQTSVTEFTERDRSLNDDSVKKEDFEAIETLLRNTKAKIDKLDHEQVVKKEHLDPIELLIGEARDSVNDLVAHLEDVSKKDDVNMVESLIRDVLNGVENLKECAIKDAEDLEKVRKTDVEAVEAICLDTKTAIDQMLSSDIAALASKEDIQKLEQLVIEFKGVIETHKETNSKAFEERQAETVGVGERVIEVRTFLEEFRDRIEIHAETDAKAFEERQAEIVGVSERVTEVKSFLEEFKAGIKTKLEEGVTSVEALSKFVGSLGETITQNASITEDVRALSETMKEEFEKSNAGVVGSKLEADEKFQQTWDKFNAKFEEKFTDIMTKYDDAQILAEAATKSAEERHLEIEAVVLETKSAAEDFKLLTDNLSTSFSQSADKIDDSSKIVFNRVDELFSKVEEVQTDAKSENQLTRDEFLRTIGAIEGVDENVKEYHSKILGAVDGVDGNIKEYHPRILGVIDGVDSNVKEYHPKILGAIEGVDENVKEYHPKILGAIEGVDGSVKEYHPKILGAIQGVDENVKEYHPKILGAIEGVDGSLKEFHPKILSSIKDVLLIAGEHYEHSKIFATTFQEKIAEIPPPPELPLLLPPSEKYDDTDVHEKLDKLVDHVQEAAKSFAQLDMLDKIHQQVMKTAAEVSDFVTAQTHRIADDHEDKEKVLEAATIALERRLSQKEFVEATVVGLREEEERLKESVSILRGEKEDLAHQKMRLSTEISSLETALQIRREELHTMEARAEGLERRIVEGVIDHSRALLVSKAIKGRDALSRKRVSSNASTRAGLVSSSAPSKASHVAQSAVNMVMCGSHTSLAVPINKAAGSPRRILSLNQITNNVPAGGFTRSHSVKHPSTTLRKSSWGGSLSKKYGDLNKENLQLKESEEEDDVSDTSSDGETMRRTSSGTTVVTGTETGVSESVEDSTEWTGSVSGYGDTDEEAETDVDVLTDIMAEIQVEVEEDQDGDQDAVVIYDEVAAATRAEGEAA